MQGRTGGGLWSGQVGDTLVGAHEQVDRVQLALQEAGLGLVHLNKPVRSLGGGRGGGDRRKGGAES